MCCKYCCENEQEVVELENRVERLLEHIEDLESEPPADTEIRQALWRYLYSTSRWSREDALNTLKDLVPYG